MRQAASCLLAACSMPSSCLYPVCSLLPAPCLAPRHTEPPLPVAVPPCCPCSDYSALEAAHGAAAKPLEVLVAATNRLGQLLSDDQQEALMQVGGRVGGWAVRSACWVAAGVAPAPAGPACWAGMPAISTYLPALIAYASATLTHPVLQELPKAMTKTSMLLVPLAREA